MNRTNGGKLRLDAYFANLSTATGNALRRSARNWQTYAAVTGSAMAMATSASAGVIYTDGPTVTASINDITGGQTSVRSANNVGVANNRLFSIAVRQFNGDSLGGSAFLGNNLLA